MFGRDRYPKCGGALVGDKYVVTAAHCLKGFSTGDVKVIIGDTSIAVENEARSSQVEVLSFKRHPLYNSTSNQNDIAIIVLKEAVDLFSFPNIKPVCLPSVGKTFGGQLAVVSGWGRESTDSHMLANLNEVTVRVYADGSCGLMDYYKSDDMLCAGVEEDGKDACVGDSGGPLITTDQENNGAATLIGVVSWGLGCAIKDRLDMYAEVSHFRTWLDQELSSLNTCPPPSSLSWHPTLHQHTHGIVTPETENIELEIEQVENELLEEDKRTLENNLERKEDQIDKLEQNEIMLQNMLILEKKNVIKLKQIKKIYERKLRSSMYIIRKLTTENKC